jgi:5-methylcytosine-specific restriction endonuclease McrA
VDRFGRVNNYWLGKKLPKETVEKIRLARIGTKFSEVSKLKMRLSHLGKKHTKETKRKISLFHKGNTYCVGRIPWNKGVKGLHLSPDTQFKKGMTPWIKGKHHTEAIREKISQAVTGKNKGETNPAWKGGISKRPYPFNFDKELKELIRKRDNYKCRNCGVPQEECIRTLPIHHIDYDKTNINPDNLITLCYSCHGKTMHKREYWKDLLRIN